MEIKIDKVNETPQAQSPLTPQSKHKLDVAFWVLIAVLVAGGIVANHILDNLAFTVRLAGWIVLACIVILLIFRTTQGHKLWKFASDARMELRKVVWPTRQEATHITMIVAALVVVVALLLWAIDALLLWGMGWLNS